MRRMYGNDVGVGCQSVTENSHGSSVLCYLERDSSVKRYRASLER